MQSPTEADSAIPFWPRNGLDRGLAVVCGAFVVLSCVLLLTYPFGRDQGIFAVIGQGVTQGRVPYLDLWDVKTPGIFGVFALSEFLFGHTMIGPRILEVVALLLTCLALIDLGRRWFRDIAAGYLSAAILAILHFQLDFWHTSQPETYGGMLLLWSAWILTGSLPRRDCVRYVLGGVLLGWVALFKPHSVIVAPLLIWGAIPQPLGEMLRERAKQFGWTLVGGASVIVACTLLLVVFGAWDVAIWTWRDFAPGYAKLGGVFTLANLDSGFYSTAVTLFVQLSAVVAIGLILAMALGRVGSASLPRFWWLLAMAAVLAFSVLLQQKSFRYHFAVAFPFLAAAAGSGWALLWRLATSRGRRYAALFLCAFWAAYFMRFPITDLSGSTQERTRVRLERLFDGGRTRKKQAFYDSLYVVRKDFDLPNTKAVAAWVRREVAPSDTLLVWGCDSIIYWLSERRPATRFIHNIPQRGSWQSATARRLFMEEIRRNRPKAVVVQHGDVITPVTGEREDSAGTVQRFPEFAEFLRASYGYTTTIGKFDIFVR